jgi:hypothetical protein
VGAGLDGSSNEGLEADCFSLIFHIFCKLAEECLPHSESADAATEAGAAVGGVEGETAAQEKSQNKKKKRRNLKVE